MNELNALSQSIQDNMKIVMREVSELKREKFYLRKYKPVILLNWQRIITNSTTTYIMFWK